MRHGTAFDQPAHAGPGGESKERALRAAYVAVRAQTERLAAPLSPEDQTAQSMPDASPAKWHRAHTSWFFETFVLSPHAARYTAFHGDYEYLFNSYYNAVGEQYPRAQRGLITRPSAREVGDYRAHVDAAMELLLQGPLPAEVHALITLGLHHEQQHQELLLTDLKHLWSHNPHDPVYDTAPQSVTPPASAPRWLSFEEQIVSVGHADDAFAFDNESPQHRVLLAPYGLAERLVSVGEVLAFVEDGGYQRHELWLDAGWQWLRDSGARAPLYWRREADGEFSQFTLHGRRPLQLDQPATHLSYFEADAFARWAGARLPTEAEWEHAAPAPRAAAMGAPLSYFEPAASHSPGFFGSVWQWTRSDYAAYPRFRAATGAVGEYNGKFMCGQYVLRGSSAVTPSGHARLTYRNFFGPGARWQFSGLRLARDE